MGTFTRDEIDRAFEHYRAVAKEAGTSNDWRAWADLFTEDAKYIEHHFGEMRGREAIFDWISTTMKQPINEDMTAPMYDSPEGAAIIRADVHRFIDAATGWRVLTRPSSRPTNL